MISIVDARRADEAAALAPMAVLPDRQCRGIGSRLVRAGLDRLRDRGYEAVVVPGHPGYYRRFGFSPALARKIRSPFPGDPFMAIELLSGALAGTGGSVRYPSAFGLED